MRPSGPSCVDAGVEPCRRLHVLVAQELPNQFVRPGIRVENDLRCYVPELVACQLEADMSEYAPLDCYRDSPESSRPALAGYEQSFWATGVISLVSFLGAPKMFDSTRLPSSTP